VSKDESGSESEPSQDNLEEAELDSLNHCIEQVNNELYYKSNNPYKIFQKQVKQPKLFKFMDNEESAQGFIKLNKRL